MDRLTRLLLEAQSGDRDALEQFVVATHNEVLDLCRYLGDRDNADDLAQETYQRAVASLHRYRASGPARHWLLTIARRTCADAARRRARGRRLQRRLGQFEPTVEADEPTHHPAGLDDLLYALDDDRRAAFVLTQLSGFQYQEAAEILDVPVGTIRSRVARAREQLVGLLRELDDRDQPSDRSGSRELRAVNERPRP